MPQKINRATPYMLATIASPNPISEKIIDLDKSPATVWGTRITKKITKQTANIPKSILIIWKTVSKKGSGSNIKNPYIVLLSHIKWIGFFDLAADVTKHRDHALLVHVLHEWGKQFYQKHGFQQSPKAFADIDVGTESHQGNFTLWAIKLTDI